MHHIWEEFRLSNISNAPAVSGNVFRAAEGSAVPYNAPLWYYASWTQTIRQRQKQLPSNVSLKDLIRRRR